MATKDRKKVGTADRRKRCRDDITSYIGTTWARAAEDRKWEMIKEVLSNGG